MNKIILLILIFLVYMISIINYTLDKKKYKREILQIYSEITTISEKILKTEHELLEFASKINNNDRKRGDYNDDLIDLENISSQIEYTFSIQERIDNFDSAMKNYKIFDNNYISKQYELLSELEDANIDLKCLLDMISIKYKFLEEITDG